MRHWKLGSYCAMDRDNMKIEADNVQGGSDGFEKVLDLLEDGCSNLMQKIKSENK